MKRGDEKKENEKKEIFKLDSKLITGNARLVPKTTDSIHKAFGSGSCSATGKK